MVVEEQVTKVPIRQVKPAPDNPRQKVGDVTELAMSIKSVGVRNAITVRRTGKDTYEVIAGARRLAAAELAGLDEVPVSVVQLDEHERVLTMAIENLQREDLTPLEEAAAYQRLMDVLGVSQRELAPKVGKNQSHISKRLALLELPADVREDVDAGGITIADAVELSKLAGHPERIKAVVQQRSPWIPIGRAIEAELRQVEKERKVAQICEELESKGIGTVTVATEWNLPKGMHRLKGGRTSDQHALDITTAKHEPYSCHRIAVTAEGLQFPVCVDRKQHKDVKTLEQAARAKRTAGGGGQQMKFEQPKETPAAKKIREAHDLRRTFAFELVKRKPAKEALQLVLLRMVKSELDYSDIDAAELAVQLGLIEPPEDGDARSVRQHNPELVEQILDFARGSEAQLGRVALAVTIHAFDGEYSAVDDWIKHGSSHATRLSPDYVTFLRSQGHKLTDVEQKAFDRDKAKASKATAKRRAA
jgi:ParB/RepB/Spo0J family partition protein